MANASSSGSEALTNSMQTQASKLWIPGCTSRGTSDILILCLSTIFISSWSAFHDDIPRTRPENRRLLPSLLESTTRFMAFILLPETLPSAALEQLREAYIIFKNMKYKYAGRKPSQTWTFTHSFYAAVGGYAFDCDRVPAVYRYHLNLRGFLIVIEENPNIIPRISEESILARSQRNSLTKLIAVVQVLSFCMTCILRRSERLSVSILEISTIGYAFCAILAYAMWWKKPCIMTEPTLVGLSLSSSIYNKLCEDGGSVAPETNVGEENYLARTRLVSSDEEQKIASRDARSMKTNPLYPLLALSAEWCQRTQITCWSIISITYGLFHLFAWDAQFPTHAEIIIWRTCTILAIVLGPITINAINILTRNGLRPMHAIHTSEGTVTRVSIVMIIVYSLARLVMILETFRQILYLPQDAFQVASWSNYLPHFS